MRILVISNLYPPDVIGGYELGCQQMVEALRGRGHAVRVVTSTPRSVGVEPTTEGVHRVLRLEDLWAPDFGRHVHPMVQRLAWMRAGLVQTHNLELLRAEIEGFAPDVVYLWNLLGLGAAAIALFVQLRGLPWSWHLMDAAHIQMAEALGDGRRDFIRLLSKRLRGHWISCSQVLLDELAAAGAELGGTVETLPNWVYGERPQRRTSWYVRSRPLRCVWSGRLVPGKGVDVIVEALALLRNAGAQTIELEILGDGPERPALEARVAASGLDAQVRFRGMRPHREVLTALAHADLFLYPTEMREPFAFSALEAAAAGCVPIVTAGCGITEWLVDGVHLVTAERTPIAFAGALAAVQAGEADLAAIGRRAQAIAAEMHVDGLAARVEAILDAAAAQRQQPPVPWADLGRIARIAEQLAENSPGPRI